LIQTAHAPIFGIDPDFNVNEWNGMAENISEYTKEEVWRKPFLEIIEVSNPYEVRTCNDSF